MRAEQKGKILPDRFQKEIAECPEAEQATDRYRSISSQYCYCRAEDIEDEGKLTRLGEFCFEMGRAMNQGEVGVIIQNEYYAIAIPERDVEGR